jgi:hypothetical protein
MANGIEILLGAIILSILFRVIFQSRRRRREDRFLRACGIHVLRSNDPMRSRLAGLLRYARRFRKSRLPVLPVPLEGRSESGLLAILASHGEKESGQ